MSRTCDQHPEMYPLSCGVYDPDADGWKADALAELRAAEQPVADHCNREIALGGPCVCIQAGGPRERLLANPACPMCGGRGRVTKDTLVAGLDALHSEIDQLASTAGDICTPAKTFLDLAWWHSENAIRQITGACSMGCKPKIFCACCHHYNELKAKAEHIGRALPC